MLAWESGQKHIAREILYLLLRLVVASCWNVFSGAISREENGNAVEKIRDSLLVSYVGIPDEVPKKELADSPC
jgi:hypothetical protein